MSTLDLSKAFELSAALVESQNYHEMTHVLLSMIRGLKGVEAAASYEIFGDIAKRSGQVKHAHEFLIRRFPLSLDDQSQDENFHKLEQILDAHDAGPHYLVEHHGPWMSLDVTKGVKPRRIVLVKGHLSEYDTALVSGLFGVYANQVALLDKKERDQLTHLPNRQSFDMLFQQVLEYFNRNTDQLEHRASWLVILDVDNFKSINDQLGHLYGDEVLLMFAGLIEKTFRYSDFIFRFGGDEFVLVLNQTDYDGAMLCLERFRRRVESFGFSKAAVTTSIGATKVDPHKPSSMLIEEADRALYSSKQKGRNAVSFFDYKTAKQVCVSGDVELF